MSFRVDKIDVHHRKKPLDIDEDEEVITRKSLRHSDDHEILDTTLTLGSHIYDFKSN